MDLNQAESPLNSPSQDDLSTSTQSGEQRGEQLPTLAELEKMDKFRFDGQEWTAKDLKNAILRQQDYTRKTQDLSEARKTFENERKFYENLHADLNIVKQNPHLAQEFLKIYPQKFHGALKQIMGDQAQLQSQQVPKQESKFDVDVMSRLTNLEKFYHEQEVAKNEAQINSTVDTLSKKYPDAIPEMAIGRVFEAYAQALKTDPNAKLTPEMWEDTFKSVDKFMKDRISTMYRTKQQEQLKANKRASDVSSGGGTVGRAPQKFSRLKDVTEYAVKDLTGRS